MKFNSWLRFSILLLSFFLVAGCATTFGGFDRVVTRAAVKTTPPNLPYTFLNYNLATPYLNNSGKYWTVTDITAMQRLVDQSLMGLKSNSTVLHYSAGRHILLVFCPAGATFETITLDADIVNSVSTVCP